MNAPMHSSSASATDKQCDGCGTIFKPARPWQRFCADPCRTDFHRKQKIGPDGRLLELERNVAVLIKANEALARKAAELEQRIARLDDPTRVPA